MAPGIHWSKKRKKWYLALWNFCRLLIRKFGAFRWMHPRKDIGGCLYEKTRTGVSFIPGWLFDFVLRSHDDWVILKVHFMLRFIIANITHALLVPVYRQTDFTREWVDVSRLHDIVAKSRTGVKFSPRCGNRGELAPGRLAPAWHFVVVSCKQMSSDRREPEWTRPSAKVAPVLCKHPYRF